MKKLNNMIWGLILVVIGVIIGLNAFGITNINIFFDGWWTLFLIIPCSIGLYSGRDKTGNLIGLLIGVFLLLCAREVISISNLLKLIFPMIIIVIGAKMILKGLMSNKSEDILSKMNKEGTPLQNKTATFSAANIDFNNEVFENIELNAIFGSVKCDLRNAIIEKDCVINAYAIFGGIDIIPPTNVKIKVNSNSIFGGVSNKAKNNGQDCEYTLYVNANCMFGGIDIK